MAEKIPYWKLSRLLGAFVWKDGEDGCEFCTDENLKLSLDRPPPPLRDQPPSPKPVKTVKEIEEEKIDPWIKLFMLPSKVAESIEKIQVWAATPDLPKVVKPAPVVELKKEPAFDIQQIPSIIHSKLGLPFGASMLKKWFDGELNYARNADDLIAEINQRGEPYPPSMIDRSSVKMKWVLGFDRAARAADELVKKRLTTNNAVKFLRKALHPYRDRIMLNSSEECDGDMQRMHREFQFQLIGVEGSWSQKVAQFVTREVSHRGVPDELTFVLGSFSIYAAVGQVYFYKVALGVQATITHVNLYVRDSFDFMDREDGGSQYLGHWGEKGVAILPMAQVKGLRNLVDTPDLAKGIRIDRRIWYAVKNSDFRQWQRQHLQGGDYMIYTDFYGVMLAKPIGVLIPKSHEDKN